MRIKCGDGVILSASKRTIEWSKTIKDMLEGLDDDVEEIPVPNVLSNTMKKILEYCNHHAEVAEDPDFDKNFLEISNDELYDTVMASNYLDIEPLLDLCCNEYAQQIRGKDKKEIRKILRLPELESDDGKDDHDSPDDPPASDDAAA